MRIFPYELFLFYVLLHWI